MGRFSRDQLCIFAFLFNEGQLLKEKNLLSKEQILSFKSWRYLRKEAIRNYKTCSPLSKWWKGADLYHIRMISLGGVHFQL